MWLTLEARVIGEALHQRGQCQDVRIELGWLRSRSATLIDLRSRGDPGRPRQRSEADPLHRGAREDIDEAARRLLAERDQEGIGEMTHHLMRRHPAPASAT